MANIVGIYKLTTIFLFTSIVCLSHGETPKVLMCADKNCKGIISMAKTTLNYNAGDAHMVSFLGNREARVIAKEKDGKLWKISIQNREGFAPKDLLREQKILIKTADLIEVTVETKEPEAIDKDAKVEETKVEKPKVEEPKVEETKTEEVGSDTAKAAETTTADSQTIDNTSPESVTTEAPSQDEKPIESTGKDVQNEDSKEKVPSVKVPETIETFDETANDNKDDVVVDEDDELEREYATRTAVKEPPFIKKEVYTVGVDAELDKQVKLEVVGMENNATKNVDGEIKSSVENIEPTTTAKQNDSTKEIEPEIKPTTPLPAIEPDTKNISVENIEPSETVPVALDETKVPNEQMKLAENVVEYDGTTIILDDLVDKIEATKESNPTPTPVVESVEATKNVLDEQPSIHENTVVHTKQVATDAEPVNSNESNEVIVTETPSKSEEVLTSTELPPSTVSDPVPIEKDASVESVTESNSPENNDNFAESLNEYLGQSNLPDHTESSIVNEVVDEKPIVDSSESTKVESPALVHFVKAEINEEELPKVEETATESALDENNIFSPNYKPETTTDSPAEQIDEGNWYDGIVVLADDLFITVQGLFNSKTSEEHAEPQEHIKTVDSKKPIETKVDPIDGYCEKLEDGSCPKAIPTSHVHCQNFECLSNLKNLEYDKYANEFLAKIVAMSDVIFLLFFTGFCVLLFTLGHYWLANNRAEKDLILKLNNSERNLLKMDKECSVVKAELIETRRKLTSIADKSFGTDDMIKQCESEKVELREQIAALEIELEASAEAGLELNKMLAEVLAKENGSDSIINSVEELQRQLNEQEATTVYINNLLAEKSRENSELQVLLNETNSKFGQEIDELLKLNESLKTEKETLETEMKETVYALEAELNRDLQTKSDELHQLTKDYDELKRKFDEITTRWQISSARAEALEDSMKKLKDFNGKDIKAAIEITDANARMLAAHKENESLKEQLESEIDNKRRSDEQIKIINNELNRLRAELNQHEKDKLEAQTRLDVLSNYFKEKETQLQKELSVKEALFMKQQGESTSTVERIRSFQEEIQGLRSQNDQLRAEIEAQSAAHKAQINAAESRAHDSWLAAKQAERRLEEARSEALVLRKKLTSLSMNPMSTENTLPTLHPIDGMMPHPHDAPSPIHMDAPGSPLMNLPLPPFMPPPPMVPLSSNAIPPPFMPPPPLVPLSTHEMRPAPLGRLMSPPPPLNNYVDDRIGDRYGDVRDRYGDNRYNSNDRYDYPTDLYETETDYSPPRSPEPYRRDRNYRDYSPSPTSPIKKKTSLASKGTLSSGSVESASSNKRRSGKV